MFIARIVFFRLHESPRYLVHAGRHLEAIESLQMISRFNGSDLTLELEDVQDQHHPQAPITLAVPVPHSNCRNTEPRPRATSITIFSATDVDGDNNPSSGSPPKAARPALVTQYNSTDAAPIILDGHSFTTPAEVHVPAFPGPTSLPDLPQNGGDTDNEPSLPAATPRPVRRGVSPGTRRSRRISSVYERRLCECLPQFVRKPLWAWWDRVMMVLTPEWLRTTLLVWAVWCSMALGEYYSNYGDLEEILMRFHSFYDV